MRNKRLDVLRCIAVLLVLANHAHAHTPVNRAGWIGVDLFFVLSGFLISGLLFAEYKQRRAIDFKRFFIRRGFKIYPTFYLLMLFTVPVQLLANRVSPVRDYLAEIFYVQNYLPHIWIQTWSLAVEEHFYILLPLFLLVLIRVSSDRENPFRSIPAAFVVVALACLAFRIRTVTSVPPSQLSWNITAKALMFTHERIDALFFGVLLGYFYHFKPQRLGIFESRNWAPFLVLVAAALVSTSLVFAQGSRFMLTLGLTALYLGFGIILMLCLQQHGLIRGAVARGIERIGGVLAFVGMYSYSIYVWHVAVSNYLPAFLRHASGLRIDLRNNDLFYYPASLAFGILMSRLIEYPILRLRDHIFPSASKPLTASQYPRS